jgi:hypothetical protein
MMLPSLIAESAGLPTEHVGRFKTFVASPPAFVECRFHETVGYGTPISSTNYYFVRWQTNAVVVQTYSSETDFLRSPSPVMGAYLGNAAGRFESNYWHVGRTAVSEWTRGGLEETAEAPGQMIRRVIDLAFSRIMSGGPQRIEIGAVVWDGDSYTVTDGIGLNIRAQLFNEGAAVKGLDVSYTYQGREVIHYYRYRSFLEDFPFIPSRIERLNERGQVTYVLEIVDLRLAERPMTRAHFAAEDYYHRDLFHHIFIDHTGHRIQRDFQDLALKRRKWRSVFVAGFLLVTAGALALHLLGLKNPQAR